MVDRIAHSPAILDILAVRDDDGNIMQEVALRHRVLFLLLEALLPSCSSIICRILLLLVIGWLK